jgi:osmotically-inducible protein OsmY
MKITSLNKGKTVAAVGLILTLVALPLLLGGTGCASNNRYDQGTAERNDDQKTSSRVRAALGEDTQYKYGGVTVATVRGKVQLGGFVNSRDQKNRAADLAGKVMGVKQVANNITVQESAN